MWIIRNSSGTVDCFLKCLLYKLKGASHLKALDHCHNSQKIFHYLSTRSKMNILHFHAQFAHNNYVQSFIKVTPFFAHTGHHPQWRQLGIPEVPTNLSAKDFLTTTCSQGPTNSSKNSQRNTKSKCRILVAFNIHFKLVTAHIMRSSRLQGSYAKLDYQQSNLFVISTQINEVTLFLDLPQDIRLHLIVYNSLMETRNTSNLPNRVGCHPIFDPTC